MAEGWIKGRERKREGKMGVRGTEALLSIQLAYDVTPEERLEGSKEDWRSNSCWQLRTSERTRIYKQQPNASSKD
jgi:hypothetical protein